MPTKKTNIQDLEQQYLEAKKNFEFLQEQFEEAKKKEEEEKQNKLAAEKPDRYEAVVEAYKRFEELRCEYVRDYGYFTFKATNPNEDSHSWFWKTIGML